MLRVTGTSEKTETKQPSTPRAKLTPRPPIQQKELTAEQFSRKARKYQNLKHNPNSETQQEIIAPLTLADLLIFLLELSIHSFPLQRLLNSHQNNCAARQWETPKTDRTCRRRRVLTPRDQQRACQGTHGESRAEELASFAHRRGQSKR